MTGERMETVREPLPLMWLRGHIAALEDGLGVNGVVQQPWFDRVYEHLDELSAEVERWEHDRARLARIAGSSADWLWALADIDPVREWTFSERLSMVTAALAMADNLGAALGEGQGDAGIGLVDQSRRLSHVGSSLNGGEESLSDQPDEIASVEAAIISIVGSGAAGTVFDLHHGVREILGDVEVGIFRAALLRLLLSGALGEGQDSDRPAVGECPCDGDRGCEG